MKISKQVATIFIIISSVALVLGAKALIFNLRPDPESEDRIKVKGPKSAPITIVEFIDFQCPACATGSKYLRDFMKTHPEQIRLEMKYFPLTSIHKHAMASSKLAECASKQDKFWAVHDLLIDYQSQWKALDDPSPVFDIIIEKVDLDTDILEVCLEDLSIDSAILADQEKGKSLGVRSTPSYFVNKEMVVGLKELVSKINKLLKEVEK